MGATTASEKGENNAWTFRGYQLEQSAFATSMAHFYRGEISRSNTWHTRLDATTNWAVITTAAALTFSFSSAQNPHFVLLLVLLLVLTFLYIEARRYCYYELWYYRVHLMETDFFAAMLAPPFRPAPDSLLPPTFPLARWEAMGLRFRRNYFWLITLLLVSWGIKLASHPIPASTWSEVVQRAAIGSLPGVWVIAAVGGVYALLILLGLVSSARRRAGAVPGKRLPRMKGLLAPRPKTQERLALIITSCGECISQQLMTRLGRGVTALEGKGMYTGERRDVLLCAVTDVQVPHLEAIVQGEDPHAFVVVSSAEEVRGWGFAPS